PAAAAIALAFASPGRCPRPLGACTLGKGFWFPLLAERRERKAAEAEPAARERPERSGGRAY
ncbi:hypothetical protein C5S36_04955, partial [Candidatus Methanophagaceae archaeon]